MVRLGNTSQKHCCDYNFVTFDNFGVKNDQEVSHNMILMSKYNIRDSYMVNKGKTILARQIWENVKKYKQIWGNVKKYKEM